MKYRFAFLLLGLASIAHAGETRQMYRGARAMAMGNAYTAIADDEMAVFLNPAGLAGQKGKSFHLSIIDVSISTDTISSISESISAFKNLSTETLNVLIGKNIFAQTQFTPTITFPGFGIAGIADAQMALQMQNAAYPQTTLGYQTTNGVQVAYGTRIGKSGGTQKGEFRVGIGAKMMTRRGGYRKLTALELVGATSPGIKNKIGNYGRGYGVDFGTQYIRKLSQRVKWSLGATYLDFGDTNFGNGPDPMKGNVSAGTAATLEFGLVRSIFSFEFKNILDQTDIRKKTHLGIEFKLPIVSFFGGVNQVYFTYGASVDLWLFKVVGTSYAEEQGSYVYQNAERRYMVRIDTSLFF